MRPRLSKLNLWQNHAKRVCDILAHALVLLQSKPGLLRDEVDLNRELHICLREANDFFYNLGQGIDVPVVAEARNQPSSRHRRKAPREDKRPDFIWGFRDNTEQDPQKKDKFFCIECKRLGNSSRSKWMQELNENYVNHGVIRFLEEQHGYASDVDCGAMVGYIENSDFDVILQDVNATLFLVQPEFPEIQLSNGNWGSTDCNILQHTFERLFPISPFALNHYWIDLRGKLTAPSKARVNSKKKTKNTELRLSLSQKELPRPRRKPPNSTTPN